MAGGGVIIPDRKRPQSAREILEKCLPQITTSMALMAQEQAHLKGSFAEIRDAVIGPDGCLRINGQDIAYLKGIIEGPRGRIIDRFNRREKTIGASIVALIPIVGGLLAILREYGLL